MSKGWLIGGALFLLALLIASVVVAILEKEEPLPEGTPEATVQHFVEAVEDDDLQAVYDALSTDLQEECPIEEFFGGAPPGELRLRGDRIILEGTRTLDSSAFVTVRITEFHGSGPFGASESSFEQRFSLRKEEGRWRFADYPWPFFRCGPFKPFPEPRREALPPERIEPEPTRTPAP